MKNRVGNNISFESGKEKKKKLCLYVFKKNRRKTSSLTYTYLHKFMTGKNIDI